MKAMPGRMCSSKLSVLGSTQPLPSLPCQASLEWPGASCVGVLGCCLGHGAGCVGVPGSCLGHGAGCGCQGGVQYLSLVSCFTHVGHGTVVWASRLRKMSLLVYEESTLDLNCSQPSFQQAFFLLRPRCCGSKRLTRPICGSQRCGWLLSMGGPLECTNAKPL